VLRLLAHPRFRAAFDFLELRLAASDAHAEDVAFWREAQLDPAATIAASEREQLEVDAEEGGGDADAPRKRRRRRRCGATGAPAGSA
jgi:poly(A) polymerase